MKFLDKNFLLKTETAQHLYHKYAKKLPIIDYHNHLNPKEIAENKQFKNLTEIWLQGDHYKWRAMRANGIDENFITGNKSDKEKFEAWAETVPYTMRNPLFHWTHLELQRYFNIDELLSKKSASRIYEKCSNDLKSKEFSVQALLSKMNVELLCTTDDPSDELAYHQQISKSDFKTKVLPTFRPDNALLIEGKDYLSYLKELAKTSKVQINSLETLLKVLKSRVAYFHELGCRLSDHGLTHIPKTIISIDKASQVFKKRLQNETLIEQETSCFKITLLSELAKLYYSKDWTMQLHLGAIRNNNSRLKKEVGTDVGCDSIGDFEQAQGLSHFLNDLDNDNQLPKTIVYNLNPSDNEVFAAMAGNFTSDGGVNKVQYGAAWWFLDQKDGIEKQLNTVSNMGLLSRSVGMLTDSRSFLSFPRHEYFRRILCNLLGDDIENGELPNDEEFIGEMIQNICYYNAKAYFKFD